MDQFIAAIDQGTTSTRCIIFNHESEIVAVGQKEHAQIYPKPGWVEHDPLEIWANTQIAIQSAVAQAGITCQDLTAFGVTNQRETTILWDKFTGQPCANAIVWQDTRTDEICARLTLDGGQDRLRAKTGLPLATYFSGPKISWMLDNIPGLRYKAENGQILFGTSDSWIIWNLTGGVHGGVHITDVTNASRTLLMDLQTLTWDKEILEQLNIPEVILPRIVPSARIYGKTIPEFGGIPVASDLGDQQAALFGQTCYHVGEAKNTYGTGCFLLMNTGTTPIHSKCGLLTTLGYQIGQDQPVYCLEGSIAITGALVQWLRDNLRIIEKSADIESLARTVEDNGDVYFVPAFSGLFAPYWRSDARGVIAGLTRFATSGHIARAALEATAYQTREVVEAMQQDSGIKLSNLRVDGGMVHNELLMQFQSDMLGVPLIRSKISETTALGAAYAAGLAVGYWKDQEELRSYWKKEKEWSCVMDHAKVEKLYHGWKKAVERTFNWIE
jgi:glycerol kinase